MEKAYLQALSVVVGAELRYVAIITTNARYLDTTTNTSISIPDTPTPTAAGHSKKSHASEEEPHPTAAIKAELARPYYLCIGKHSFCILDREMSGNSAHVVGGYLIKVPFRGILQVRTCGSNKDAVSIDIQPNQAVVPCGCTLPPSIYIRSGSSDRIVQQLRICWKADNMYRTLSVKDLFVEQTPNLLNRVVQNLNMDEDHLPDSWIDGDSSTMQREGFSAQAPMPQLKMFETRSYMFYAPKDFSQVGRKDSGHFVRAGGSSSSSGGRNGKSSSSSSASSSLETLICREFKRVQFDSTEVANVYDKASIKTVCEHYVRTEIAPTLQTFRHLDRPKQIMKRGNACGDPASWDAWMVVLRTGESSSQRRLQHEDESNEGEERGDASMYANR